MNEFKIDKELEIKFKKVVQQLLDSVGFYISVIGNGVILSLDRKFTINVDDCTIHYLMKDGYIDVDKAFYMPVGLGFERRESNIHPEDKENYKEICDFLISYYNEYYIPKLKHLLNKVSIHLGNGKLEKFYIKEAYDPRGDSTNYIQINDNLYYGNNCFFLTKEYEHKVYEVKRYGREYFEAVGLDDVLEFIDFWSIDYLEDNYVRLEETGILL